jgi:phenylpyruvate tautomerase PptA (4-oxalocrotonate tautomerase family)
MVPPAEAAGKKVRRRAGRLRLTRRSYASTSLSEGRSLEKKRLLYKTIAERLQRELGVRPQDVFVNLIEVKKENWSFGLGEASYAPAEEPATA